MRPITLASTPVYQSALSGPTASPYTPESCRPLGRAGMSVTIPLVVMRPTESVAGWANHSAPSGPGTIRRTFRPDRALVEPGTRNSVNVPAGVMRATELGTPYSVIHRFPSGPAEINTGSRDVVFAS